MNHDSYDKLYKHHNNMVDKFGAIELSYCDPAIKTSFHKEAKKYMRLLAATLDIPRGSFDVRSNVGGIAGSGEVTLHSNNLYAQMSQSVMFGGRGLDFLIRGCLGRKDYGGLGNRFCQLQEGNTHRVCSECEGAIKESKRKQTS